MAEAHQTSEDRIRCSPLKPGDHVLAYVVAHRLAASSACGSGVSALGVAPCHLGAHLGDHNLLAGAHTPPFLRGKSGVVPVQMRTFASWRPPGNKPKMRRGNSVHAAIRRAYRD